MTIRESLTQYLMLSAQISEMEGASCQCTDNFFTCENCLHRDDLERRYRAHLKQWAEIYTDELARREGMLRIEEEEAAQ